MLFMNRKGKPGESRGRKAMGLMSRKRGYDCQAAEFLSQHVMASLDATGSFFISSVQHGCLYDGLEVVR